MITASLKQHVSRRFSRRPAARFGLLVKGRLKSVWEKKGAAANPAPVRIPALQKIKERLKFFISRRKRISIAVLASFLGLALIVLSFLCFAREPVRPLALPASASALAETFGDKTEAEESGPVAASVFKKLKVTEYSVRARDSLASIAKRSGLDLDTIISFNHIRDARGVTKGAVLSLPNQRGLLYRVRRGDSLLKLSRRFGVSLDDLLDWNNLSRSDLKVGQKLFIPGARLSSAELGRVMGTTFVWPARGSLSSSFGMRLSPITSTRMHHNGIDISNRPLTPILAAASGRVALADYNPTYGNFIILVHDDGMQTLYGHLEKVSVKKGACVAQGQKIGGMGSTGASTGSHLHFSIFKNGRDVDPLKYLPK